MHTLHVVRTVLLMFTLIDSHGVHSVHADLRAVYAVLPADTYICGTAVVTYSDAPSGRFYGHLIDMRHEYTRSNYGI